MALEDSYNDTTSKKMQEFLASISLARNYLKNLERITANLTYYKQEGEGAVGEEQKQISKKIEDEINRGMNIQNSLNDLMKNITNLSKTVKEEVNKIKLKN